MVVYGLDAWVKVYGFLGGESVFSFYMYIVQSKRCIVRTFLTILISFKNKRSEPQNLYYGIVSIYY